MHLYRSNRMEELATLLGDVVKEPLGESLAPETIVVQSAGMERWLSQRLAVRFGVWANARFPFPRALIREIFDATLGPLNDESPFERPSLIWSIARVLPEVAKNQSFQSVLRYLDEDTEGFKRHQLAERLAYLFDQYVVYRPDLVLGWQRAAHAAESESLSEAPESAALERFDEQRFQAALFRELLSIHGDEHVAARAERFFAAWGELGERPAALPERLCVFGVSILPPLYVRVLEALSPHVEVHCFLLSASSQSAPDGAFETRADQRPDSSANSPRAILSGLEQLGRDGTELFAQGSAPPRDVFVDPGEDSTLHALQRRLLGPAQGPGGRGNETNTEAGPSASPADGSISVHACHTPLREVQVLHDALCDRFEKDPALEPHEVLVMTPDIDAYAPYIDAVFGASDIAAPDVSARQGRVPERAPLAIPFRIADRSQRADSMLAEALLRLLAVFQGRFGASEVTDLLQLEPVRQRFEIDPSELPDARRLLQQAGVRWAVDAAHRKSAGQPETESNTWRFGLKRLLLGWAEPDGRAELVSGVHPERGIEGDRARLLGKLCSFAECLFEWRTRLAGRTSLKELCDTLARAASELLKPDERLMWQLSELVQVLRELGVRAERAGFDESVGIGLLSRVLGHELVANKSARAFMTGGVTFCAMLPMRSVPFKVIALLGLNDGAFPRPSRSESFDLMARQPALGDRSLRQEDRWIFLEALLSARQGLFLSYIGRDVQDNSVRPPSVVVSELLEAVDALFADASLPALETSPDGPAAAIDAAGLGAARACVVEHPLHPFDPRYFASGERGPLFSYNAEHLAAALALSGARAPTPPFLVEPIPAPEGSRRVELRQLIAFFKDPCRTLARTRLRLDLDPEQAEISDREPIEPSALERFKLGETLLELALAGAQTEQLEAVARASGALPLGASGRLWATKLGRTVLGLARAAEPITSDRQLPPLFIDLEIGTTRLQGALTDLWLKAQLWKSYQRIGPKHTLACWIQHLALNAAGDAAYPGRSVIVGRDPDAGRRDTPTSWTFAPLPARTAQGHLNQLFELYWLGQTLPLPLFPETSHGYARNVLSSTLTRERALMAARRAFDGSAKAPFADGKSPYVRLWFREKDALAPPAESAAGDSTVGDFPIAEALAAGWVPDFETLALTVYGPLLEHSQREPR